MHRALVLTSVLALAVGCGEDAPDPAAHPRGPAQLGEQAAAASPALSPMAGAAPTGSRRAEEARAAALAPRAWGAEPIADTETIVEPSTPARRARDYSGELQDALGAPSACITPEVASASGGTLRIPVMVVFTEGGRATRAEVSGTLPAEVRECVRRRAELVTLQPPIEGAPRTVHAQLVIEVRPDAVVAEPAPVPQPAVPAGAQAPGIALPAVGATGRPAGFVPPGTTLPALGGEGRPAGFVPPSSTLPAQAP